MGPQNQVFLVGVRLYKGTTTARQGDGSAGNDADFRYLNPDNLENSDYVFPNYNQAVFVENIFYLSDKLSLTPGIRYENILTQAEGYYKQRVLDFAGNVIVDNKLNDSQRRRRSFVIAGLGMSYKPTAKVEFYGNISQNYRAINFTDLRVVNPNFAVDPNIQDERGYTTDLGMRGNAAGRFIFDITLFMVKYNGRIGQLLKADQPPLFLDYRLRTNISDARNLGVEAFSEVNLLSPQRKNQLNWFVNGALIDARYINTQDNAVRNKKVEMVPPVMLRTGLNYRRDAFSTSLQFSHTAVHFSDATNARRTSTAVEGLIPAYQVVDFSASYRWRFLTTELSINNLLDARYFTRRAEAYPGPGIIPSDARALYLTVQGRF
jgi:Fe(3+) dicitrate transport protein